jgi:cytochrome c-type protein NapC/trimethylamine-N-oxide reductase cytochrome c-type subunit TorC
MTIKAAKPMGWIMCTVKRYGFALLAGLVLAIACFFAVNAITRPFSTSQYCGSTCHEMGDSYRSWELSLHYANRYGVVAECVDCHLPPKEKFFTHLIAKAYAGAKDIYKHHFGDEYDAEKLHKKVLDNMPNGRCLKCHSNLLGKAGSSAARIAHQATLNPIEDIKPRCVECHQQLHERERKVFPPD